MRYYLASTGYGADPSTFVHLLDGRSVALIANAVDGREDRARCVEAARSGLTELGLDVAELDLRDHFGAREDLADVLGSFDGIWCRGGNSFVLRRAMRMSGFDAVLAELLARDALVYAGSSAGAIVVGSTLRGIELMNDPQYVPPGYDAAIVWDGLGLVEGLVVPHFRAGDQEALAAEQIVARCVAEGARHVALGADETIVSPR